jgi:prophage antirepressor-like protein
MDKIYKYIFDDQEIIIINDNNNYWFHGLSIGGILEYTNIHKALKTHIPVRYKKYYADLRSDKKIHGQTIFISEPGLFRLIMKSKQPNALEFQDWITDELLPELRKNNEYKLSTEISNNINILLNSYAKLKTENKNLKNLLHNNKHVKNGIVYAKQSETTDKINYKIGSTENSVNREKVYKTGHVINNDYVYYIEVNNIKLAEKIIRDKLYKYRINSTTEIFNCSLNTIKQIFNKTKELIDLNLDEDISSSLDTNSDIITKSIKKIKKIKKKLSNK